MAEFGKNRNLVRNLIAEHGSTSLWTDADIEVNTGLTRKQSHNVLYQLWMSGELMKHKTDDPSGKSRYAAKILNGKGISYLEYAKQKPVGQPRAKYKKKNTPLTEKEIRKTFDGIINQLMALESRMVSQLLENNDKSKVLGKVLKELEKVES